MAVTFNSFTVYSSEPFLTIESAAKVAASAADIHKFSAYNQLHDASWAELNAVTGYTGGSISVSDGDVIVTGYGEHITEVRSLDRYVRFKTSGSAQFGGIIFVSSDGSEEDVYVVSHDYYSNVLLRPSSHGYSYDTYSMSHAYAPPSSGECIYEVYFTERRYSSSNDEYWVTVSIYLNDQLVTTLTHLRDTSLADYPLHYVGFRGPFTYYDVHISGAGEVADPLTIDPGDTGAQGLSRVIDGLNFKMMMRFDETLHVFRTGKAPNYPAPWSVDAEDVVPGQIEYQHDLSQIKPHVRVVGAYEQADFVNTEWVSLVGDRFALVNNSYLLTLAAVRAEAQTAFLRMLEAYYVAAFTMLHNPFIEVEDNIEVEGEPFIVNGFNVSWSQTEAMQDFEVRNNPYED